MCEWPGRSYLQCLVARRAAALLLRREPALSAPAATTAAPTYLARSGWAGTCCSPGHHSARSPPPCTPLPATGRGKVAEHVRKSCALSRRRLATHHGRAALPRPGQARPGLLRLLPAGGGHRMTCRAGLRGFLRGGTPAAIKARSPGVQESSGPSVRALPGAKAQRTYGSEKKKAVSSVQPSSAELSALDGKSEKVYHFEVKSGKHAVVGT